MEIEQKERERIEAKYPTERQGLEVKTMFHWMDVQLSRQGSAMEEHLHLQKEVIQPLREENERLRSIGSDVISLGKETSEAYKKLEAENNAFKSLMIAAAEEIQRCWPTHCDAEGYGPTNLMHRLEKGIPSQYGYTAGAFAKLEAENKALRDGIVEFLTWMKKTQRLSIEAITAIDQLLLKNEG